jgi:hypothetical protein
VLASTAPAYAPRDTHKRTALPRICSSGDCKSSSCATCRGQCFAAQRFLAIFSALPPRERSVQLSPSPAAATLRRAPPHAKSAFPKHDEGRELDLAAAAATVAAFLNGPRARDDTRDAFYAGALAPSLQVKTCSLELVLPVRGFPKYSASVCCQSLSITGDPEFECHRTASPSNSAVFGTACRARDLARYNDCGHLCALPAVCRPCCHGRPASSHPPARRRSLHKAQTPR